MAVFVFVLVVIVIVIIVMIVIVVIVLIMVVVVVMLLFSMGMSVDTERKTVVLFDLTEGNAEESVVSDERETEIAAIRLGVGIPYEAIGVFEFLLFVLVFVVVFIFVFVLVFVVMFFFMMFFEVFVNEFLERLDGCLVNSVAADFDIVVTAPESVEMESHVPRRAVDPDQGIVLCADGVMALLDDETRFFRQAFRNPVVDDVDDAADGAAAVKQGRRPANDFQPFRQCRIHRIGMVGADSGSVGNADSVLQNLNAVAGLAANHRQTHSGAE